MDKNYNSNNNYVITWWQGLLQLLSLFCILDHQCIQVTTASHLEFHIILVFLYLYRCKKRNYQFKVSCTGLVLHSYIVMRLYRPLNLYNNIVTFTKCCYKLPIKTTNHWCLYLYCDTLMTAHWELVSCVLFFQDNLGRSSVFAKLIMANHLTFSANLM